MASSNARKPAPRSALCMDSGRPTAAHSRPARRLVTPPAPPPLTIREEAFQQLVIDLATVLGWEHYHPYDSRRSDPGWPDLVLALDPWPGRGRVIYRELKTERGRLTRDQQRWGRLLTRAGLNWAVWKPSDWQAIIETLTAEGA